MRNGDIHQGTLTNEFIQFESNIGHLKIPKKRITNIKFGKKPYSDIINTVEGETLIGSIVNSDLTIQRILDTTLPLNTNDIFKILSISKIPESKTSNNNVALETSDGSRLIVSIKSNNLLLKGSDSLKIIDIENLRTLDLELSEENSVLAQVRSRTRQVNTGKILTKKIKLKTRYGGIVDMELANITSLLFDPGKYSGTTDFSHRWKTAPTSLIRDTMLGGGNAPEMIELSGGTFIRGDANGDSDERKPEPVNISSFAIGTFEVTFNQYDLFCNDARIECPDDEGWGRGNRPVINVSWKDATAYTLWLSKKTRQRYRLPTDSEWEYAARSNSTSKFWWGDEPGIAKANCEGCGSPWDGNKSAVVGKFPANSFGLHDTAGNVFEWVSDCWHDDFSEAPTDGSPVAKPNCGKRVIRGGAWSFQDNEIRSANRWRDFPSRRSDDTGFRLARDL